MGQGPFSAGAYSCPTEPSLSARAPEVTRSPSPCQSRPWRHRPSFSGKPQPAAVRVGKITSADEPVATPRSRGKEGRERGRWRPGAVTASPPGTADVVPGTGLISEGSRAERGWLSRSSQRLLLQQPPFIPPSLPRCPFSASSAHPGSPLPIPGPRKGGGKGAKGRAARP